MKAGLPCATKLRLLLNYEPTTGVLTWRLSARRGYKPGAVAGTIHRARNDYRIVVIEGQGHYAQRIIWKMMTGRDPACIVDHADNNTLNNAWSNLRAASLSQNGYNRRINKNNKSGVKGVHWDRGKWRAVITVDKRAIRLGKFSTVSEAAAAIDGVREQYHGTFARAA